MLHSRSSNSKKYISMPRLPPSPANSASLRTGPCTGGFQRDSSMRPQLDTTGPEQHFSNSCEHIKPLRVLVKGRVGSVRWGLGFCSQVLPALWDGGPHSAAQKGSSWSTLGSCPPCVSGQFCAGSPYREQGFYREGIYKTQSCPPRRTLGTL